MIRRVVAPEEEKTVWGVTNKGVGALAFEYAMTIVAIVLAALAFAQVKNEGTHRVRVTCEESNRRHQEAIPKISALITPPLTHHPTQTERERRHDNLTAVRILEEGRRSPDPKRVPNLAAAYNQINSFINIFAPVYNCSERVKQLTR